MNLVDLLICVFAAAGLADLLLKDKRLDRIKYWIETREVPILKDLVNCRFCLTHWTAAAVVVAALYGCSGLLGYVVYPVLFLLAVVAAANRLPGGE